jgi:hypothetical protein
MTTDDVEVFILEHRDHGQLMGDAADPTPNGYEVTITCPCSVVFDRWETSTEATMDLAALARLN